MVLQFLKNLHKDTALLDNIVISFVVIYFSFVGWIVENLLNLLIIRASEKLPPIFINHNLLTETAFLFYRIHKYQKKSYKISFKMEASLIG